VTWSRQKTLSAAIAGCSVRERTPDPRHAVAMAFTSSNKWITLEGRTAVRFRGAMLFIVARFRLLFAFPGMHEIDLRVR
jgi:hypothetical protein